jgi:hypothetical protein
MKTPRQSGMRIAWAVGLMTAVLCATSGPAEAADVAQQGASEIPSAPPSAQTFGSSTLTFAGYPWTVKSSTSRVGPGPNIFDPLGPFVDSSGALHLRIVKVGKKWECSEVILNPTLGYGTYSWTVQGPVSTLNPNVVLALFTYEDSNRLPSHAEIDFEASRFGNAGESTNAQYVVQPYQKPGNLHRITLKRSATVTTVVMTWVPGRVSFSTDSKHLWTNSSSSVPTSSTEQVHMNLWLDHGIAPTNGDPVSVTVTAFEFTPA